MAYSWFIYGHFLCCGAQSGIFWARLVDYAALGTAGWYICFALLIVIGLPQFRYELESVYHNVVGWVVAWSIESILDMGFATWNRPFGRALVEVIFSCRSSTQSLEDSIWGDMGLPFRLFLLDFF